MGQELRIVFALLKSLIAVIIVDIDADCHIVYMNILLLVRS